MKLESMLLPAGVGLGAILLAPTLLPALGRILRPLVVGLTDVANEALNELERERPRPAAREGTGAVVGGMAGGAAAGPIGAAAGAIAGATAGRDTSRPMTNRSEERLEAAESGDRDRQTKKGERTVSPEGSEDQAKGKKPER